MSSRESSRSHWFHIGIQFVTIEDVKILRDIERMCHIDESFSIADQFSEFYSTQIDEMPVNAAELMYAHPLP